MKKKKVFILWALLLAALIAAAWFGYDALTDALERETPAPGSSPANETPQAENVRVEVPDFTVLDMDGNAVAFSSLVGKPMVLNFWATWCSPCKQELPDFEEIYQEYGEEVVFMMINMTDGERESVEMVRRWLDNNGTEYTFPVYFDTELEAAYVWGISSIPVTAFVDAQGYLVNGQIGQISTDVLREAVENLLEESK